MTALSITGGTVIDPLGAELEPGAALYPQLADAFLANAVLNGLILGVLLPGILYSFRQVLLLRQGI